ncbi:MAG TPA: pectinesterase family protein [Longimicrobiaceae bacterium]|nr:pectinesterase family protein [Longimicrobiaceae bacterium]
MKKTATTLAFLLASVLGALSPAAPAAAQAWSPDVGPAEYRNPIIFSDFSDPDVIRVGGDFYMTASSFGSVPALPILHSKDLVHWRIVNYAIDRLPEPAFDQPQNGNGVWAPSIRYHDGWFWIFYGDPDRGIYMVKTKDPLGKWNPPVLVRAAKGWIDPTPLWDDDGKAYLVHAFANSRAGVKSILHVNRMSPDGTKLLDDGKLVYDGHGIDPTIEGPKFYKRNGYYYIFAPAGGVPTGWQVVLRSKNVYGPYERRVVMAQGKTPINGPHQGGWVELANGQGWFVHFQDRGPYGRIIHLQPLTWKDDWPVIGSDPDGDGTGQPVLTHRVPNVGAPPSSGVPQTSDDFASTRLGLQWQWNANPRAAWYALSARPGWMRLFAQPMPDSARNLWLVPNLLLQKFPTPAFLATTEVDPRGLARGEHAGLLVMGMDYAYLAVRRTADGLELLQARSRDADRGSPETAAPPVRIGDAPVQLRATVGAGALVQFSYSLDGKEFRPIGEPFQAREGKWIGARVGLFAERPAGSRPGGHADFDGFRVEAPARAYDYVVAKDGTGDFTTIQAAVDAVRDYTPIPRTIFIKNGVYHEKLLIPSWKTGITLVGESVDSTIIDYDDYSGKGDVNTFTSYTARISGDDIHVYNVTFRNSAGPVGQALALFVEGDRVVFHNCRFLGNQDTIFAAGEGARQYFVDSYIEGTTDFIFGPATAYFENCEIHSRANSYVTAASTPTGVPYGFVFVGSRLTADPGVTQVYLGRPWRDHARTVFLNSWMGPHIRPEGWSNWSRPETERTAFYAEYGDTGPGAGRAGRVAWSKELTAAEAARYTKENVLCDGDCGAKPWWAEESTTRSN